LTTQDLVDKLGLKALSPFDCRKVEGVFISDMVSDVMAGTKSGHLWITMQTHKSIVPAANLVDISAIVITGGKQIPEETINLASRYRVLIFSTELTTFELVGTLYKWGLKA